MQILQPLMKPPFLCHSSEDALLNIYKHLNLYHTSMCLFHLHYESTILLHTSFYKWDCHCDGLLSWSECWIAVLLDSWVAADFKLPGPLAEFCIFVRCGDFPIHCLLVSGPRFYCLTFWKFPKTERVLQFTGVTSWRLEGSCDRANDLVSFM